MYKIILALTCACTIAACTSTPVEAPPPAAAAVPAPSAPANTGIYKSAAEIPLEDFFKNSASTAYRISPDGKYLAYLKSWKNRMNIFVRSLADATDEKQMTFQEDRDIADLHWKGGDYVLFSKDNGGDENFHLYAVNIKTGVMRELTPFRDVRAELLDDLSEVSKTDVLITMNQNNRELFDVYRFNVETGAYRSVLENKYKISTWLIDHTGKVRGGVASDGVNSVFYFEKFAGKPFEPIFKTDFRNAFVPFAFAADNKHIFAMSNLGRDLMGLVEVDPKLSPEKFIVRTLYAHPKYDLADADYSLARKAIGRVGVITDRRETYFLDPQDQADWDYLKNQLGGGSLVMDNTSRDENLWIVHTRSDKSRGEYFAFDRTLKQVTSLGNAAPWLQPELMSEMKTIHYKTRDGLEIEGYLTVPNGQTTAKNLPVIVHPHGGPWARDEWGFNPEAQFLASRGYAVLQMNFRGSTGYGRKFWEASFKQWGRKMQDDITDGLKALEADGTVDRKRACIYGGSYGGYATLAGITLTPDLYTCAVDYVGVANLFTFMKTIPPYWKPFLDMMYVMVGNPETDKTQLTETSPVFHADKIKAALFIAQGANDPRVNKNESDQMVEALRKRGVDVEYMVKANEGHGFHNEENRFDFYRAMEKFLAKHLKGSKSPGGSN